MLLLFAIPICFAEEKEISIGLNKSVKPHNVIYWNGSVVYNPPSGYEIDSVTLEAQWNVVNYTNCYEVKLSSSNKIYNKTDETAPSMTISMDVTNYVVNSSGSIKTDIEFRFSDSVTEGFDVPNCTAKFIVKLKPKTTPGTTIKAPIPPLAIILALMAIPINRLKILDIKVSPKLTNNSMF